MGHGLRLVRGCASAAGRGAADQRLLPEGFSCSFFYYYTKTLEAAIRRWHVPGETLKTGVSACASGTSSPGPGKIGLTIPGDNLRMFKEFLGEVNFTIRMAPGEAIDVG
jgi:hypothetical protein